MNSFDIIGPVMIGPSSSHTAGAVRIGLIARLLLSEEPVHALILLHGSFAKTYRGHGTDKALTAGLLGMKPDNGQIRNSTQLAKERGVEIEIVTGHIEDAHPNTALITLTGKSGKKISVQGSSIGGGNISITQVNGMSVKFTGQYATLIIVHQDMPGTIANVTEFIGSLGVNICNFRLSREKKGGIAIMTIEMDGSLNRGIESQIQELPGIISAALLLPN